MYGKTAHIKKKNQKKKKSFIQNKHFPYLIHENIKDACGNRQREEGEEKSEEPGGSVHGCVKTLGSKMDVQLGKLLLKKTNFKANLKPHSETLMSSIKTKNSAPPGGQK